MNKQRRETIHDELRSRGPEWRGWVYSHTNVNLDSSAEFLFAIEDMNEKVWDWRLE